MFFLFIILALLTPPEYLAFAVFKGTISIELLLLLDYFSYIMGIQMHRVLSFLF